MNFIGEHFSNMINELPNLMESTKPVVFFEIGNFKISSIVVTTWLAMILIIIFVLFITSSLEKVSTTKRQVVAEKITLFFYCFTEEALGDLATKIFGILGSIFIIILVMNFMWLIPTLTVPTASFSTTFALTMIGFLYTQGIIIKETNLKNYIMSYGKPNLFMLFGNVMSVLSRPISLSMRLFGNMFAGKILDALVMIFIPLLLPIAFYLLSILAGVIQAYVFTLLLAMYINEGLE